MTEIDDTGRMTWQSYTEAVVRVTAPTGEMEVRPATTTECAGQFPDPAGRAIHIITAHNPHGRDQPAAANATAHGRLLATLRERGLEHWDAAGADPTWTHVEQSVAVLGLSEEEALALGRDFDQEAVFAWTPQTWSVISCDGHRRSTSGWSRVGPA